MDLELDWTEVCLGHIERCDVPDGANVVIDVPDMETNIPLEGM